MKKLFQISMIAFMALAFTNCKDDTDGEQAAVTVTDADGNVYATVKIGDQTWMLENLKTTKFNDGTAINEYSFDLDWYHPNDNISYYQWSDTNDLNNLYDEELPNDFYGAQYNEFALASGKLAPEGWRIPSVQDFMELENFLTSEGYAGNEGTALKSSEGWTSMSNGTNAVGFNALPNGYVSAFGGATGAQAIGSFATSNNVNSDNGPARTIVSLLDETILYGDNSVSLGAGVRCIKND